MLDIDSLRLTDEKILDVLEQFSGPQLDRAVADAQLAKALWGMADWLEGRGWKSRALYLDLRDQLLAAGMTRPEGE